MWGVSSGVERALRMREAGGSIPPSSITFWAIHTSFSFSTAASPDRGRQRSPAGVVLAGVTDPAVHPAADRQSGDDRPGRPRAHPDDAADPLRAQVHHQADGEGGRGLG